MSREQYAHAQVLHMQTRGICFTRAMAKQGEENWEKAKNLLLGAVDVVLEMKGCRKRASESFSSSSSSTAVTKKPSAYEEHRRLFGGYQPSKVYSKRGKSGGKGKKKNSTWTKEVVCLKERDQQITPSTEEKIEWAQLNLGLRKLVFCGDGDATNIHDIILEAFPILSECGGYTLMRVSDNSHDLVAIEGPDGGVTVPFLKDILRQAKLYVRPLQCDVPQEKLKLMNKEAKEVILIKLIGVSAHC